MTNQPKYARYMWLLPLAMLILAALACDDVYVPPPMVDRVEADTSRVYARVINIGVTYETYNKPGKINGYQTNDSGITWQPSDHVFAKTITNSHSLSMYGEALELNGFTVWSYPRSIFRGVFYDGTTSTSTSAPRFQLPDGFVSNAAQGNMLYVSMGTEGVLVAHLNEDGDGFAPDWHISSKGMDALVPLPLTITQPITILTVILVILLTPPFALVHAYLLQRVWAYVLPSLDARRMALRVTAGLVVLAIIGIIFWLTNDRIDLYEVLAVLTGITVLVGVTITVLLAGRAQVTDATRFRLVIATVIVSLIVPGGVAALFAMWWLVFGIVFIYWAYQRVFGRFVEYREPTPEGRVQRWRVDRIAIEMVLIITVGTAAIIFEVGLLQVFINRVLGSRGLIELLSFALALGGLFFVIRHYSSQRAKYILKLEADAPVKRELRLMTGDMWMHTIYWIFWTALATAITFIGQMAAYSWFTSLLKTTVSRG
ncbi:MAG: hypothetical protein GC179_17995 [Anaerolineaceae bacterium]|nr:hypothetical protein [Anaerolineaceae bacterium]